MTDREAATLLIQAIRDIYWLPVSVLKPDFVGAHNIAHRALDAVQPWAMPPVQLVFFWLGADACLEDRFDA